MGYLTARSSRPEAVANLEVERLPQLGMAPLDQPPARGLHERGQARVPQRGEDEGGHEAHLDVVEVEAGEGAREREQPLEERRAVDELELRAAQAVAGVEGERVVAGRVQHAGGAQEPELEEVGLEEEDLGALADAAGGGEVGQALGELDDALDVGAGERAQAAPHFQLLHFGGRRLERRVCYLGRDKNSGYQSTSPIIYILSDWNY